MQQSLATPPRTPNRSRNQRRRYNKKHGGSPSSSSHGNSNSSSHGSPNFSTNRSLNFSPNKTPNFSPNRSPSRSITSINRSSINRSTPNSSPSRGTNWSINRSTPNSSPSRSPSGSPDFSGIVGSPGSPLNLSLLGVARSAATKLQELCAMLPHIDGLLLREVYRNYNGDAGRVVDYFQPHSSSSLPQTEPTNDPFIRLPNALALEVFTYIDLTELARFRRTTRECNRLVKDAFNDFRKIPSRKVSKFRFWHDDRILCMLSSFPNLEYINLRNCERFYAFDLLSRNVQITLKRINLSNCAMLSSDNILTLVTDFPYLDSLDLSKTNIEDLGMDYLAERCTTLKYLNLQECHSITDSGIQYFMKRATTLETLNLNKTKLRQNALEFPKDNVLSHLDMRYCQRSTRAVFEDANCVLQSLNMSFSPSLRYVEVSLVQLRVLNLASCKSINTLRLHAPQLVSLNLSHCVNLTHIEEPCVPILCSLNIFMCRSLSSDSLAGLITSCGGSLKSINAEGMIALRDRDVVHVLEQCTSLGSFRVEGCKELQNVSVNQISEALGRIQLG